MPPPVEEDETQENKNNGNPSPSNKLLKQAETEMALQVPCSESETGRKRDKKKRQRRTSNTNSSKRKRNRSKSKYRYKKQKLNNWNEDDKRTSANSIDTRADETETVYLEKEGISNEESKDKPGSLSMKFTKFSFDKEEKILSAKGSYFKLVFNKNAFREFIKELRLDLLKVNERIKFKSRAKYIIQHLCEEYLVFWFSQLTKISEFAHRKTIMKVDSELYNLLINRLLQYDNLSFIKEIPKGEEGRQPIDNSAHNVDKNSFISEDKNKMGDPATW